MTINGTQYEVLNEKKISGTNNVEVTLRKLRGKRSYHVVRYEDGSLSSVV